MTSSGVLESGGVRQIDYRFCKDFENGHFKYTISG